MQGARGWSRVDATARADNSQELRQRQRCAVDAGRRAHVQAAAAGKGRRACARSARGWRGVVMCIGRVQQQAEPLLPSGACDAFSVKHASCALPPFGAAHVRERAGHGGGGGEAACDVAGVDAADDACALVRRRRPRP
eukprot:3376100-Pleurochrysis_carterae.AAC.3